MIEGRRGLLIAACLMLSGCAPAWGQAELLAVQLVGACDRVADAAALQGARPDQGAQAARAARQVAEALARPVPDGAAITVWLAVVDAALSGLSTVPALRERVHVADAALLALRVELVRR